MARMSPWFLERCQWARPSSQMSFGNVDECSAAACAVPTTLSWDCSCERRCLLGARQVCDEEASGSWSRCCSWDGSQQTTRSARSFVVTDVYIFADITVLTNLKIVRLPQDTNHQADRTMPIEFASARSWTTSASTFVTNVLGFGDPSRRGHHVDADQGYALEKLVSAQDEI